MKTTVQDLQMFLDDFDPQDTVIISKSDLRVFSEELRGDKIITYEEHLNYIC